MNGKLTDVIIEEKEYEDRTGLRQFLSLTVWADAGMKDAILGVEGVTDVFQNLGYTEYSVYLDPRYDREYVKAEIEAAIKCAGE